MQVGFVVIKSIPIDRAVPQSSKRGEGQAVTKTRTITGRLKMEMNPEQNPESEIEFSDFKSDSDSFFSGFT